MNSGMNTAEKYERELEEPQPDESARRKDEKYIIEEARMLDFALSLVNGI